MVSLLLLREVPDLRLREPDVVEVALGDLADGPLDLAVAELEGGRRPLVELLRQRAHGGIALGLDLGEDRLHRLAHLGVGRLDGAGIHAAFEMASHGSLLPVVIPGLVPGIQASANA